MRATRGSVPGSAAARVGVRFSRVRVTKLLGVDPPSPNSLKQVMADPQLSPFFSNVNVEKLKSHQVGAAGGQRGRRLRQGREGRGGGGQAHYLACLPCRHISQGLVSDSPSASIGPTFTSAPALMLCGCAQVKFMALAFGGKELVFEVCGGRLE